MGYKAPAEGADRLRPLSQVIPWAAQSSCDHCSRVKGWDVKDLIVLRLLMVLSKETLPSFLGSGNGMEPSFPDSWLTVAAMVAFVGHRIVNGKAIKQPINLVRLSLLVRDPPELRFSLFISDPFEPKSSSR